MDSDICISVRNLSKRFKLGEKLSHDKTPMTTLISKAVMSLFDPRSKRRGSSSSSPNKHHEFWALKNLNFDIRRGERLGVLGRNGAGKSTLLKILARVLHPTEGEIRLRGRTTALLEVGTGFSPALTGRENVYLSASLHGLGRDEIGARFDEIVDFSGVGDFIDEPFKNYSSGMKSRLGFSVAAHLDPEILILDEVLAVGDMAFVQKCLKKIEGLTSGGRTVIFVSHSIGDVVRFCDRAIWLDNGQIVQSGGVHEVAQGYASSMMNLVADVQLAPSPPKPPQTVPADERDALADPERPAAEILSFRLLDREGRPKSTFLRQEPVRVQLRFRALRSDLSLVASVHLHQDEVHVLSTHPQESITPRLNQDYSAEVEVPPFFLNKGVYHFSAAVVTPVRPILRHVRLERALSFSVFDRLAEKDIFAGDYRGVVRPELIWHLSQC